MKLKNRSLSALTQKGTVLIESMISILIFSLGVLAVVGLQAVAVQSVTDSKSRSDAGMLANRLIGEMWVNRANLASYAYAGSGTAPSSLTNWMSSVNYLPNATTYPPVITVDAVNNVVTITLRWQLPEDKAKGLPPHNYTTVATIKDS